MNVPEIQKFKEHLEVLKSKNYLTDWEIPYENLLTRLDAAFFFVTLTANKTIADIRLELKNYPDLHIEENVDENLSQLDFRISFSNGQKRQ